MTKTLTDLLEEILGDDEASLAVAIARERLAATLGLRAVGDTAVSINDMAAYASGSFTPDESRRFEQQVSRSPDAAADVAFGMHMLADVKADAAGHVLQRPSVDDVMPLSLADEIEALDPGPAVSARGPSERTAAWEQEIRRRISAFSQGARVASGRMIEVLSGLLPAQSDAWSFPATPAFATRGTSHRTTTVEGVGKNDGSLISVTADCSQASVRLEVVVRGFPSDRLAPTLMVFSAAPEADDPIVRIDPSKDTGAGGVLDLYYEPNLLSARTYVALMLERDGAITFAAEIAPLSKI